MIARTCEATALDAENAEVPCGRQATVRRGDFVLCDECSAESFVCECPAPERRLYVVTHHDGSSASCAYCDDCAALAEIDWNGEIVAIRVAS